MNYLVPERLDALARDYAMGLMHGSARRRFKRVVKSSRAAELAVLVWQHRLATLAAAVAPMPPRPIVWERLAQRIRPGSDTPATPAAAPPGAARAAPRWGWLGQLLSGRTLGGALAGVMIATVVLHERPALLALEPARETLPASYVGLLLDNEGRPTLLASSRRHGRALTVKMLQPLAIPAGKVATLWALPRDGTAPFRVGAVPAQGSATLPLPQPAEKLFFTVARLSVTFEDSATAAAPSPQPVLSGHCVKLW
jgi:anti-sigma-K factor RskA